MLLKEEGLSFDDVLLVPKYGILASRKDADISSELVGGYKLKVPIIGANMPSVMNPEMARGLFDAGAFGFLHRFNSVEENIKEFLACDDYGIVVGCSIGINEDFDRVERLMDYGASLFLLDVAHGYQKGVMEFISAWHTMYTNDAKLIVGNVATYESAMILASEGIDALKVGIGPGAACITREVTGFGVPQLTAIMEVARALEGTDIKLIADGGIKSSGDIVKALAAGADTVMLGKLLSGANEAPLPGEYYGNASKTVNGHNAPEGIHGQVGKTGPVKDTIKQLAWGIRSGISYGGATNLQELRENAQFQRVAPGVANESGARL